MFWELDWGNLGLDMLAALFVIVFAHLGKWIWHKYRWYIQSFNIGAYAIVVSLAGLIYEMISQGSASLELKMIVAQMFPSQHL